MHAELPSYGPRAALTGADRVDAYLRVLNALMLRDMRGRLFGSYWGWLAWTLWPVAHMMIISIAMVVRKVPPPFGDSTLLFAATGAVPALAFSYISSEVMKGLVRNKPLLYYPQVRSLDMILSVMMVEIVDNFIACIVIAVILLSCGINPMPSDITTALGGYLAAIMFGISMGMLNTAIVAVFPGWVLGYVAVRLGLYFTSGAMFDISTIPQQIRTYMEWNPIYQIVGWVRLGYSPELEYNISYFYILAWIFTTMAIGLAAERTISRRYGS